MEIDEIRARRRSRARRRALGRPVSFKQVLPYLLGGVFLLVFYLGRGALLRSCTGIGG